MSRRFRSQTDMETPTAVLAGEWWLERRAELAKMNRKSLCDYLEMPLDRYADLLWLRYRAAYAGLKGFYLERGLQVPEEVAKNALLLERGLPKVGWVNVFRGSGE